MGREMVAVASSVPGSGEGTEMLEDGPGWATEAG